jgi:hypothetical protein
MRFTVSALFIGFAVPVALAQSQPVPQPALSTAEAAQHVGENRTVCGQIANTHIAESSHGTPTFVDIDQAWPNQVFDLVIWGDKKADVGDFPKAGKICASGKIVLYKGHPEIFLEDWHSWYVPSATERASVP